MLMALGCPIDRISVIVLADEPEGRLKATTLNPRFQDAGLDGTCGVLITESLSLRQAFFLSACGCPVQPGCPGLGRLVVRRKMTTPIRIMGSDNHWPMVMPPARTPRKASGSRVYSTRKRKMP